MMAHKLISALFLPPLSFILLLLGGLWLLPRHPRVARVLLAVTLLAMYTLSTPKAALWLSTSLDIYPITSFYEMNQVDAIVVLGGGTAFSPEAGYTLNAAAYARARYAAWLAKKTSKPLLVSGGAPYGGEAESKIMARILESDFGSVPRWLEEQSNTTWENAAMSAPILKQANVARIALVTHAWHLRRAIPLFQQQGFIVLPAPVGFAHYPDETGIAAYIPSANALQQSTTLLKEWLGILFYLLKSKKILIKEKLLLSLINDGLTPSQVRN